jgi:hypothetical protein
MITNMISWMAIGRPILHFSGIFFTTFHEKGIKKDRPVPRERELERG